MSELCDLARKWTSDKFLFYTEFYNELLSSRRLTTEKVLEFGIGYPETMRSSLLRAGVESYVTGASLHMWAEYFPNADIYALDIKTDIFINEGRIKSFFCDQGDPASFDDVIPSLGTDFDLIVEDGSHEPEHQILSVEKLMPILSPTGVYIMEDIQPTHLDSISNVLTAKNHRHKVVKFEKPLYGYGNSGAAAVIVLGAF